MPPGAWVRMEEDTAHVTCNVTGQTFSLVCEGSAWKGRLSNCSAGERGGVGWDGRGETGWGRVGWEG